MSVTIISEFNIISYTSKSVVFNLPFSILRAIFSLIKAVLQENRLSAPVCMKFMRTGACFYNFKKIPRKSCTTLPKIPKQKTNKKETE